MALDMYYLSGIVLLIRRQYHILHDDKHWFHLILRLFPAQTRHQDQSQDIGEVVTAEGTMTGIILWACTPPARFGACGIVLAAHTLAHEYLPSSSLGLDSFELRLAVRQWCLTAWGCLKT